MRTFICPDSKLEGMWASLLDTMCWEGEIKCKIVGALVIITDLFAMYWAVV